MTERIDHAAEARLRILDAEDEYTRDGGPIRENVSDWLAFAQVNATLALVEQQRISNLISLFTASQDAENVGGAIADFANEIWDHMADEPIRAALGLTAGQEGDNDEG